MMNMSRHLAELCTRCAAACSIVGELLLESPTSTARANFLKHVEGWVRGGVSRGFEGFRGVAATPRPGLVGRCYADRKPSQTAAHAHYRHNEPSRARGTACPRQLPRRQLGGS